MSERKPVLEEVTYSHPWQWEEDGMTVTRTTAWTAPGCHNGCGVLVYSDENGKIVKVEGDEESIYSRGRLCPRCFCIDEVMYNSERLLYPMRRDKGRRGDPDGWERISWDEALDLVEREFHAIAEQYGPEAIQFQRGTGRDIAWQTGRLAYAVGSPNEGSAMTGNSCYMPRLTTMILTVGCQLLADFSQHLSKRYDDPRYEFPNCTIVWGCDPLMSNPDFQLGHWVTDAMQHGTQVITVDPRVTWIAAHSKIHLPLRPGTDAALAMAMVNVVIAEDLYDHGFVECWTYGFEELSKTVAEWTPERAAEVCWLDADDIRAAARLFAAKKPSNVFWGLALDMQQSGTGAAMAIMALFAITGNVDNPGGMHACSPVFGVDQNMMGGWGYHEFLSEETQNRRFGVQKYPMFRFGLTMFSPDEALIACETDRNATRAMWIQTTNLMVGMADEQERWGKVLEGLDFVAAADLFMNPTLQRYADVVLPVACWPERIGSRAFHDGLSTINVAAAPVGEVKSDAEINRLLGRRFSTEVWPWETEEEIYDEILSPAGFTYQELRERGPAYEHYEYYKYEKGLLRPDGQPGFNTPTGRIELFSTACQQMGFPPLPYFTEPTTSPVSTPEYYEDHPFILMTGARIPVFFHTEHRNVEHLRQFNKDPEFQIHPEDAADFGIENGDWVWMENEFGRCRQRAQVTEMVQKGTLLGQHGWWFPEMDPHEDPDYGYQETSVNKVLHDCPGITGFGCDNKAVLVKIYKANEEEM